MTAPAQLSSLLDNALIARLERLRVTSVSKRTARGRGEHLSGRGGASTDFVDYRDYAPGDDLRFVDWNIFARLQRPFLKQFRREEERHLVIIADVSRSMAVDEKGTAVRRLAAAFAIAGLNAHDQVSLWASGPGDVRRLAPARGRPWMQRALTAAESMGPAGGDVTVDQLVEAVLARHSGRGIAMILSDFLSAGDLQRMFTRLATAGLEPHAIQVLSPAEMDPALSGDLRLVDCETDGTLDISDVADLLHLYHEHRQGLQDSLAEWCSGRQGRFISITAAEPMDHFLLHTLRKKGWLA